MDVKQLRQSSDADLKKLVSEKLASIEQTSRKFTKNSNSEDFKFIQPNLASTEIPFGKTDDQFRDAIRSLFLELEKYS